MMRTTMAVSAMMLVLGGCGSKTENAQAPAIEAPDNVAAPVEAAPQAAIAPGQAFASTVASSDAYEIAAANLALEKGSANAIKTFARSMIKAHGESTAKLQAAAATASPAITPDPTLTPEQQQKLDALRAKTGAAFDQAYAADQVAAHQVTLDGLRTYAAKPDSAPLGEFAKAMTPIVTAHLNMAKTLKP
ncbi:putative membrane protein [Sphingomonas zeicaulis]|uniref:DUF4142 domain-containing protein n=1 Tax=Sphingomonas zeicaulis TaxID=1632740 RepID=UPI003D19550A